MAIGSDWVGGQVPVGYRASTGQTWNGTGWDPAPAAPGPDPNAGPQGGQSINRDQAMPGGYTLPNTTVQQTGAFNPLGGSSQGSTPGSAPSLSQSAYESQQATLLQNKLQTEAEQRRLDAIKGLSGGTSAHVDRTGTNANEDAARAVAFGRAKELAGNNALASVTALNDVFAGRGLHGSTIEGGEIGKAVAGGRSDVNGDITKQLIEDLNRAADIGDTTYAGNITQRGQDLNQQQTLLGLIAGRAY